MATDVVEGATMQRAQRKQPRPPFPPVLLATLRVWLAGATTHCEQQDQTSPKQRQRRVLSSHAGCICVLFRQSSAEKRSLVREKVAVGA